ncbi:MAG: 16S rRNA processing protein RimM [Actinobacteria bacterium]|nr:16S rRNA processing protein RimM [Actinomycetota bacterium]
MRVGRVGRPHGLDGAFVVEEASEDASRFDVGARLRVNGEEAAVVLSRRVGRGRPAIKLDRVVERGSELTVLRAELPLPEPGSYYVADLVGLEVVETDGERLGVVMDVLPGIANDALELDTGLLLPLVEDCVRDVDLVQRRVVVAPGFSDHG